MSRSHSVVRAGTVLVVASFCMVDNMLAPLFGDRFVDDVSA